MPCEIVIVISDLYLPARDGREPPLREHAGTPPGLEHLARFGYKLPIEEGWRNWLARWLGRVDLVDTAPACIAAAGLDPAIARAWFATPVHLIAGLTSLHFERRGILRLPDEDLATLAEDFNRTFADTGFTLVPMDSGTFLMKGLENVSATTTEPARALVRELEASFPTGPSASVLKRLGAELEMWLHGHPINQARARRNELPISTLWVWGGGDVLETPRSESRTHASSASPDLAFGSDPYLVGLWHLHDAERQPLPDSLPNLSRYPQAQRTTVVAEVTPLLHANPHWTVFQALADLDRRFVAPALSQLHGGTVASVVLIANDVMLRVQRRDRLKFWRRRPTSGLLALHPAGA